MPCDTFSQCASAGCCLFVGAIVAFVIASVYYGVVFLDLWLQVRRLNPTSLGEVSTSPTQPIVAFITTLVIAGSAMLNRYLMQTVVG
jgi:hypothetical protein